jgi:hypothetical protein
MWKNKQVFVWKQRTGKYNLFFFLDLPPLTAVGKHKLSIKCMDGIENTLMVSSLLHTIKRFSPLVSATVTPLLIEPPVVVVTAQFPCNSRTTNSLLCPPTAKYPELKKKGTHCNQVDRSWNRKSQ